MPNGTYCYNYRAKAEALLTAANNVKNLKDDNYPILFLSDSLSVLEAFTIGKLSNYNMLWIKESAMDLSSSEYICN
jgi:hypothetical protein